MGLVPKKANSNLMNWTHEHAAKFDLMGQLEMALSNQRVYNLQKSGPYGYNTHIEEDGTIAAPFRFAMIQGNKVYGRNNIQDTWLRCPAMDHLLNPPHVPVGTLVDIHGRPIAVDGNTGHVGEGEVERYYESLMSGGFDKDVFPEGVDPLPLPAEHSCRWPEGSYINERLDDYLTLTPEERDVYFTEYEKVQAAASPDEEFNGRVMRGFNQGMEAVDIFRNAKVTDTVKCTDYPLLSMSKPVKVDDVSGIIPIEPLSVCCKAPTFIDGTRRVCEKCRCTRPV